MQLFRNSRHLNNKKPFSNHFIFSIKDQVMKKLLSVMFIASLALFLACSQDKTDNAEQQANAIADSRLKTPVPPDNLPAEIIDYVALNCAPFDIEDAFHTPGEGFEVWLGDGQELYFNERGDFLHRRHHRPDRGYGFAEGRCMRGDTIVPADLPAAVNDYIAGNYPDATPETVVDKRGRLFAVELSNGIILLFNREGSFIRECDGMDRDGARRCMYGREVRPAALPQGARDYIGTHYPGIYVQKVVRKWNGVWAVQLSGGTVLLFRPDGGFIGLCD